MARPGCGPRRQREQRAAQRLILEGLEQRLGVTFAGHVFDLGDGVRADQRLSGPAPTLVEAWAHIGTAKSAQKHKIMMDALKLDWLRRTEVRGAPCILAFADKAAASAFTNRRTWMAKCLRDMAINVVVVPLPRSFEGRILEAQTPAVSIAGRAWHPDPRTPPR